MTTWLIAGASIAAFVGFVTLLHFLRRETLKRGKVEVRLEDAEKAVEALEAAHRVDDSIDRMDDAEFERLRGKLNTRP